MPLLVGIYDLYYYDSYYWNSDSLPDEVVGLQSVDSFRVDRGSISFLIRRSNSMCCKQVLSTFIAFGVKKTDYHTTHLSTDEEVLYQ